MIKYNSSVPEAFLKNFNFDVIEVFPMTPIMRSNYDVKVFDYYDLKAESKISPNELNYCLKSVYTETQEEVLVKYSEVEGLEPAFRIFDTNSDGFISEEELASALKAVGADGDGSIGYDEVKKAFDLYEQGENNHQLQSILKSLWENSSLKEFDFQGIVTTLLKAFVWQLLTAIVKRLAEKAAQRFIMWFRL